MKHFIELAKTRKTTYEFSDKKVKESDVKKIMEAGRWAPSLLNTQPWHFIIIKNEKRINELTNTAYYGNFHTNPPLIIAVILNSDYLGGEHKGIKENKVGLRDAYLCIAMPALSMIFEAEDLGISTCLLTPDEIKASKILKTRKKDGIPLMIGFGYEAKGTLQRKRTRKDPDEITSHEYFSNKKR